MEGDILDFTLCKARGRIGPELLLLLLLPKARVKGEAREVEALARGLREARRHCAKRLGADMVRTTGVWRCRAEERIRIR